MRRLICLNDAIGELTDEQLEGHYNGGKAVTGKYDISGMSGYSERGFFHILEGESNNVGNAFGRIQASGIHLNISVVADNEIDARIFDRWALVVSAENSQLPEKFEDVLDLDTIRAHPHFAKALSDIACRVFLDAFTSR